MKVEINETVFIPYTYCRILPFPSLLQLWAIQQKAFHISPNKMKVF